jgi:hypothetical protein
MRSLTLYVAIGVLASGARAEAAWTVRSAEHGSWSDSIARLRDGCRAPCTIHVEVQNDAGAGVRCRDYTLTLDAAARRAFLVGACDPATDRTALTLTDRHHLFLHVGDLAVPIVPDVSAAAPPRPPPPPPPMPPPPGFDTCWALIGPTVRDPETGEPRAVRPVDVAPSFTADPPTGVESIAFDRGWLVRVPIAHAPEALDYALVPWHTTTSSKRGPRMELDSPRGLVRSPLHLRCGGDPLGAIAGSATTPVPSRLDTTTADGVKVTLRRSRSDGSLTAQKIFGVLLPPIGGVLAVFVGPPVLGMSTRDPGLLGPGIGLVVGGVAIVAGGLTLYFTARTRSVLRRGTVTVSSR